MQSNSWPTFVDQSQLEKGTSEHPQDLFMEQDGVRFAGMHLIIDCWGAEQLDNLDHIEQALREAVEVTGATLLHIHLHHFTPNGGVSGVAVLAESHISIHTWPERNYAALDIFMCGDTKPEKAIPVIEKAFNPENLKITKHLRGIVPGSEENNVKKGNIS